MKIEGEIISTENILSRLTQSKKEYTQIAAFQHLPEK